MGSVAFNMFAQAMAGGVGGFVSSFVLFPLDALKTKSQAGGVANKGMLYLIGLVWKEDKLWGFFRGAQWRGLQAFFEKAGFFYCYAFLQWLYKTYVGAINPIAQLAIGYASEWMHAPLTMPIDTAVVRVITQRKSMFKVMGEMAKKPGDGYKGASVFILANTKVAVLFFLYEPLKALVLRRQAAGGGSADLITAGNAAMIAAVSRGIADFLLYPTRRIKVTRQSYKALTAPKGMDIKEIKEKGLYTQEEAESLAKLSNFAVLGKMIKSGGILSIYNGLFLELFRGVLSGSIMLSIKETLNLTVKIALFSMVGNVAQVEALRALRVK